MVRMIAAVPPDATAATTTITTRKADEEDPQITAQLSQALIDFVASDAGYKIYFSVHCNLRNWKRVSHN
jgi:hypothetical protein